jgi:hypothetical protein
MSKFNENSKFGDSQPNTGSKFDDETEQILDIPAHLVHILDGLAQSDDDLELDQAALSLTACIGKGKPTEETEAAAILNLVPELLAIIESKALSEDNRLLFGRGDITSNLWTCIHISTCLLDLRTVYPNLGETFFEAIFHALDALAKRKDLLTAAAKQLPTVVITVLSLWSPQIASRQNQFIRAVPIIAKHLEMEHPGTDGCDTNVVSVKDVHTNQTFSPLRHGVCVCVRACCVCQQASRGGSDEGREGGREQGK